MSMKAAVEGLRRFAAAPWFPLLVGLLSGLNLFTLFLAGPLVLLYCSACIANPRRWLLAAVANAFGTVLGCLALIVLVDLRGANYVKESFPSTFQSSWWKWTEDTMSAHGWAAVVPIAAMPIILHPLIFFGKLSNMSNVGLLVSIFVGRVLKYSIMAQVALCAPAALKFFGASKETIDKVGSSGSKAD
eukprot:TRINITY_DN66211_c0_g1_i1.p1 TRINITY_DN66211_c0_g1~~TRINITY_DN66211_c0_g1_i1.p1  ORF type:complete len:210 (+),score=42.40 TRINITY_DN66211_c0_g1_i1:69-632(+)